MLNTRYEHDTRPPAPEPERVKGHADTEPTPIIERPSNSQNFPKTLARSDVHTAGGPGVENRFSLFARLNAGYLSIAGAGGNMNSLVRSAMLVFVLVRET